MSEVTITVNWYGRTYQSRCDTGLPAINALAAWLSTIEEENRHPRYGRFVVGGKVHRITTWWVTGQPWCQHVERKPPHWSYYPECGTTRNREAFEPCPPPQLEENWCKACFRREHEQTTAGDTP